MKNKYLFGICFLVISCFISSELFAQSSSTSQLIGTWVIEMYMLEGKVDDNSIGILYTFNSDGTFSGVQGTNKWVGKWVISENKLIFIQSTGRVNGPADVFITSDGKTMVLMFNSEKRSYYTLQKK